MSTVFIVQSGSGLSGFGDQWDLSDETIAANERENARVKAIYAAARAQGGVARAPVNQPPARAPLGQTWAEKEAARIAAERDAELDARFREAGVDPNASGSQGTSTNIRTPAYTGTRDAPGVKAMDPSSLFSSGGALDFVKGIFGQGAGATASFNQSIAAMAASDAAREKARMWKLLGGGLFAVGILGFGLWGVTKLSKR